MGSLLNRLGGSEIRLASYSLPPATAWAKESDSRQGYCGICGWKKNTCQSSQLSRTNHTVYLITKAGLEPLTRWSGRVVWQARPDLVRLFDHDQELVDRRNWNDWVATGETVFGVERRVFTAYEKIVHLAKSIENSPAFEDIDHIQWVRDTLTALLEENQDAEAEVGT